MKRTTLVMFAFSWALLACGKTHPVEPTLGDGKEIITQTFVYAEKDGESLKLDIYTDPSSAVSGARPVILYQHGGGWDSDDTREQGKKWLSRMAKYGYACVSIDYRLGIRRLKQQSGSDKFDIKDFGKWYDYAITLGIEDFYDATAYLIAHANELGIDPDKIIAAGGSAGAVNVCTAEYRLVNKEEIATSRLPKGFNYAAVISCAGGVWGFGLEEPVWNGEPCPFLLFHGDKDQAVPYEVVKQEEANYSAWGSKTLARQFREMKVPYLFLTGIECDHALSGIPFYNCQELMQSYIWRVVFLGEKISQEISESYLDEPMTILYVLLHADKYKDYL